MNKRHPPGLAVLLLRIFLPSGERELILGDLEEEYGECVVVEKGPRQAGRWYWREAAATLPYSFLFRFRSLLAPKGGRGLRGDGMFSMLWQDARLAARSLGKNRPFALVVLLTLAVGIGANTTVYSVVDNLILNPFSFPDGARLVGIGPVFPKLNRELSFWEVLSPAEFKDIETRSRTLTQVVAWDMGNRQVAGELQPENVFSAFWWGDAFTTLRVPPELGRGFTSTETVSGDPVAIISHRFWQRRFGADPGIIGRVIQVNGNACTVIGVMPAGTLIYGTDLWLPMGMAPEKFPRGRRQFQVLARLAPGVSLRDANLELETIARTIEQEFGQEFKEYSGWRMVAETWSRINTRLLRPAGLILSGAVGFVMLLVCANIAGLLLGRSMRRSQELSIRAALGASRRRIICQLLTESVLLSLAGGAAGLVLAYLGIRWIGSAVSAVPFPVPGQLGLNTRVLLFTAGLSIAVGLMFGLMPALRISRSHLRDMLKCEGRAATAGTGRVRLQSVLVGVEVALAVILLAGGGLLIRSLANLHAVDTGFEPRNVLTMRLTLPREKYGPEQIGAFYLALTDRIEAIPGVHSASAATQFPPVVFNRDQLQVEGRGVKTEGELPTCYATLVSERYFDTLGIRLVRGRAFTTRDRPESPMVAIVNDVVARRYFPGEDPIGKRIKVGPPNSQTPWAEIVGIAASTQNRGLDVPRQAEVFASVRQAEGWWNQLFLLIKTEDSPWGVLEAIRREVAALDPDQPIYAVQTVEDVFSASLAQRRVASTMLSFFALFALSLAAVGIFSVVSYKVSARTREIGLRIALGATIGQVRRQVVRQAMVPVAAGAAFGLPVAVVMGRLMEDLLFQVKGTDLVTLLSVVCVLSAVATAASYLPALRASGKDPVAALRYE